MRLLLLTHSYNPESTPPQRRWNALIPSFREAGWTVDVVAPVAHPLRAPGEDPSGYGHAWKTSTGKHGETIRRVPLLRHTESRGSKLASNLLGAVLMVPAALMGRRPDVVVVTVPALPNIASGWLLARLRRRPLVVEMRDAWPDLAREAQVVTSAKPGIMERVVTAVQRRADLVVTVTEGFRRVLLERGCRRVETVLNGVSLSALPRVPAGRSAAGPLRVLYLGNHGESQGLEALIDAARLAGDSVSVRFVGTGTRKEALMAYAAQTGSPVAFMPPSHGEGTAEHYAWADTCVIALRDDWPSFRWTVPSKTYELLGIGRHITGLVQGEAARILQESGAADLVESEPAAIATLWRNLAADRRRLDRHGLGRTWVQENAEYSTLGRHYVELIEEIATAAKLEEKR